MKEYIERDAAIKAAQDGTDLWDGGYSKYRDEYIKSAINAIPAADVVEVVRCKDCVPIICPLKGRHKSDNDYCSFAIPRE